MTRAFVLALVVVFSSPARAECAPDDEVCELAEAVVKLDAALHIEKAKTWRLEKELRACTEVKAACPAPVPPEFPTGLVVASASLGLALGVLLSVLVGK